MIGSVSLGMVAGLECWRGAGVSNAASSNCMAGRRAAALAGHVPPTPLRICRPTCTVLPCKASLQRHGMWRLEKASAA